MHLAGVFIHPLKSARAIALESASVHPEGLADDRRFMLVDPKGMAVTQRDLQALAAVIATPEPGGVCLSFEGRSLSATFEQAPRALVTLWSSPVSAAVAPDTVNVALSDWFGRPLRLVFMDDAAERRAGGDWAGQPVPVGFADEFPLLVTTTGSLAALNETLVALGDAPVGMDRFRTNLLIEHDTPWDEDGWAAIEIGGIRIDLVKPCTRCIVTTQDQQTGARIGGNPIAALGRHRMSGDRRVPGVLFGWNAVPRGEGQLAIGAPVQILARREPAWPMRQRDERRA